MTSRFSASSYNWTSQWDYDPSYKTDLEDNLQEQFYQADIENFTTVLQAMKTVDGSEIADVFTPSRDEILQAGVRPEEFITSCSFDGEACDYTDFHQWQNGVYGNCFTFNSVFYNASEDFVDLSGRERMKHVKVTTHYGARYGLRLMLSPDLEEYIPAVTPGHGVRVSVHHPRTVPFPEDTGLNVPINSRTSIRVTMNDIARVKEPHGNCTSDDEWNKNYVGAYTSEGCVNVCLEKRIRDRCHCIRMLNTILTNGDDDDMVRCNPTNSTQGEIRFTKMVV
ncbi:Amiloride-sensitive sodium channel subunit beta [Amphibalanus amphitrite]|uniref:Amiloride-sensitive sodium channel subunit beta n=1 Tax=Amphibalanus amphitrite TaxID=1232801 RepID=A0A6A4X3U8_AMPAM|nr:Amiloride-sensitive sodium channel subunit beta [Amphibalanus amphitrite]